MQAPVLEGSESEDDEVDNDPVSATSRIDNGTLFSWDAAACVEYRGLFDI